MELPVLQPEKAKARLQQHQLGMLYTCPMQYYNRYVMGRKTPPGLALITGSATHSSAETNLRAKIETGRLLDEDQVCDIARDTANRIWDEEGVALAPDERSEAESTIRGHTVDQSVALARLHHRELAPTLEPIAVERTFLLELDGYPINVAGTIDVEEKTRLRDLKTYKKMPSQAQVDGNLQLTLYSLAKQTIDGVPPKELCFDIALKKKVPELRTVRTARTDVDYETLLRRIDVAYRTIESGLFNPCAPDHWVCSHDWCGYYDDICEYGRRGRSQVLIPTVPAVQTKKEPTHVDSGNSGSGAGEQRGARHSKQRPAAAAKTRTRSRKAEGAAKAVPRRVGKHPGEKGKGERQGPGAA